MFGLRIVATCMALVTLTACSSSHEDEVERVAEQFHAALEAEDGEAACDLLSEDAQQEMQQSGDDCATAILDAGLSTDGRLKRVQVYDTAGQVHYDDDTVFLGDFPEGWRVTAAGCEKQAGKPYDCQVKGG
jgi:hypothetical protein